MEVENQVWGRRESEDLKAHTSSIQYLNERKQERNFMIYLLCFIILIKSNQALAINISKNHYTCRIIHLLKYIVRDLIVGGRPFDIWKS
jgi:hypothetical protein